MGYVDRECSPGQKKLLAIDGGGIRGAMSAAVLEALEAKLAARLRPCDPGAFRLSHYFDFIGGTSTGAIIAAFLAKGESVSTVLDLYRTEGEAMFKKRFLPARFWSKFTSKPLEKRLKERLGSGTNFGSEELETLLLIVLKNHSSDSTWPMSNATRAHYNDRERKHSNLDLPLWQLVLASAAAPVFFASQTIEVGAREPQSFVDGGVTPLNNPAFQLFLSATMPEYGLGWPAGIDNLLLVSVGTETDPAVQQNNSAWRRHILYHAASIAPTMINSAVIHQDVLCRAFGDTKVGLHLDREIGTMIGGGLPDSKQFTYLRYNTDLTRSALCELGGAAGVDLADIDPSEVAKLDATENIDELVRIGSAIAARDIPDLAHYAGFLPS